HAVNVLPATTQPIDMVLSLAPEPLLLGQTGTIALLVTDDRGLPAGWLDGRRWPVSLPTGLSPVGVSELAFGADGVGRLNVVAEDVGEVIVAVSDPDGLLGTVSRLWSITDALVVVADGPLP